MTSISDDSWRRSLTGKTVGRYTLVKFLGAGKIGYVYRAQHQEFPDAEAERAVKLIFDTLRPGWQVELKKVLRLQLVDGVVHFHESGAETLTHENASRLTQFTVWDYIAPGENLSAYLERNRSVPTSFLLAVVERVLHVLHACQMKGVPRHGDLHSSNILIGEPSPAKLDDALQPRAPVYVSDFGYGATGAVIAPRDDYEGLARIINEILKHVDRASANATDRQSLQSLQRDLGKLLNEPAEAERRPPLELLRLLSDIKHNAKARLLPLPTASPVAGIPQPVLTQSPSVGQFQVSEMIGDRWDVWQRLFVPTVPARSKILDLNIPTVVTGPRGCGKTMLFRRLSERLVVECGEVVELATRGQFIALYVNANDFADAFARFPEQPSTNDEERLTCYSNLCVLADLLAVQSARAGRLGERAPDGLLQIVQRWLIPDTYVPLVESEDRLERYRAVLEQVKWTFPSTQVERRFPGYAELSQHRWLPRFVQQARASCPWIADRSVLLFIDDYSTPRVSVAMQRILNRLFLQRSPDFLAKIATEASSTFVPEDSSDKMLEVGDDYQLIDLGEESLFLPDPERLAFLNAVFSRRIAFDTRIPKGDTSLFALLDRMPLSKTEFARRLRDVPRESPALQAAVTGGSQRRGRSRGRVSYFGDNVFSDLWSGDTRTMIQLITDVVDQASGETPIPLPVKAEIQDRVFRNRGGEWLNSHTRNEPTDPTRVKVELERIRQLEPNYKLCGEYGDHLKAVVEAFVAAAKDLLLGPTYILREGPTAREVPRMAFRMEIVDEFRIDGLAREIYRDLVRYGLFIRDSRGKSVRGTFVPRLYLRRLLLPYSALALSKRDSVPLTCATFVQLLMEPDVFKRSFTSRRSRAVASDDQLGIEFLPPASADSAYDDLGELEQDDGSPSDDVDDPDDRKSDKADEHKS